MPREISTSVPDAEYARILARANACGFFGPSAVSSYTRFALFTVASLESPPVLHGVPPIIVVPPTREIWRTIVDYSIVKRHSSVEAFAYRAIDTFMTKSKLTQDQKAEIVRMHGMEVS